MTRARGDERRAGGRGLLSRCDVAPRSAGCGRRFARLQPGGVLPRACPVVARTLWCAARVFVDRRAREDRKCAEGVEALPRGGGFAGGVEALPEEWRFCGRSGGFAGRVEALRERQRFRGRGGGFRGGCRGCLSRWGCPGRCAGLGRTWRRCRRRCVGGSPPGRVRLRGSARLPDGSSARRSAARDVR